MSERRLQRFLRSRPGCLVFFVALIVRLVGVGFTSVTGANPFAQADVFSFAEHAAEIANNLQTGGLSTFTDIDFRSTDSRIGAIWAVFWLFPGDSHLYARVVSAVFGAAATYNVYRIAKSLHSTQAGIYASVPMIIYPTFVLIHSTILRESVLLFCLTMGVWLMISGSQHSAFSLAYIGGISFLMLAATIRFHLFPVIVATAAVVAFISVIRVSTLPQRVVGFVVVVVGSIMSFPVIERFYGRRPDEAFEYLSRRRAEAARGRMEYLGHVVPNSAIESAALAPILVFYFLFAPLAWMTGKITDIVNVLEGVGNMLLFMAACGGIRYVDHRQKLVLGLVIGFTIGVAIFALGVANAGHAIRLRQMFMWIIFTFAGCYAASRFTVTMNR